MQNRRLHLPTAALAAGLALAGALAIPLVSAPHASAAPVQFGAVLLAADETTPAAAGDAGAVGTADLTVDAANGQICVTIATSGLSGPATEAHIHAGGVGVAGAVVVPLPTAGGCVQSTPAQAAAITAAPNAFYVNVHTAASPGGAVRGQLSAAIFNAPLTGAAEAPGPGDPDGSGTAVVAIDTTANRVCAAFQVANITLPAAAAHIHSGVAGVAGPVIVPFTAAPVGASAASCGSAAAAVIAGIVAAPAGNYVNVHTSDYVNGAIRGQLVARTASIPTAAPVAGATTTIVSLTVPGATTTLAPGATTTAVAAATTTLVPTTIGGAATTLSPTTIAAAGAAGAATTALPAIEATPAEALEGTPAFTG